jgi:CheY-like chemotaxis protein
MNAFLPPLDGEQYTALVIDDNLNNRDIFRIALESVGFTVSECEDGFSGLQVLAANTFHLLILDLQMPLIDGHMVLHKVREQPRHTHMNIFVVTANAHMATDDIHDLADYVMLKPINVVEFADFAKRLFKIQVG